MTELTPFVLGVLVGWWAQLILGIWLAERRLRADKAKRWDLDHSEDMRRGPYR